jgi:hypothetical protein
LAGIFYIAEGNISTRRLPGWRRSGFRTNLHTNSLLTGNFTGNSAKSGAHGDPSLQETLVPQRFFSQFPTQNNRENIYENREFSRNAGPDRRCVEELAVKLGQTQPSTSDNGRDWSLPGPMIGHVFMLPHLCALDLPQ